MKTRKMAESYLPNDVPEVKRLLVLAFQHVLTMFPATVLVALAEIAGRPAKTSVGNVSSVPPPASAFMIPAIIPATINSAAFGKKSIR